MSHERPHPALAVAAESQEYSLSLIRPEDCSGGTVAVGRASAFHGLLLEEGWCGLREMWRDAWLFNKRER